MPIRFIPNDPLAADLPPREQTPRADPPADQAGFSYAAPIPEGVYAVGSPEFLYWQCREAALAAVEAWTTFAPPVRQWQGGRRLLPLDADAGEGLDAHYDRNTVSFLEWTTGGTTTWSAASTDAVAHEIGHALLDAIRPDLWDSAYTEGAAFHESFADCVALLVGISDDACRTTLLRPRSRLRDPNFLEAVAEDVAAAVRRHDGPEHPQSLPRHALNTLRWEIPVNLPPLGPPLLLTSEPHSFSRVFTGCFYDTVCNIFTQQPSQDERGLLDAARIAGRLLVTAAQNAPEGARFFQAVGRVMILADEATNGGRYRNAIRDGFENHNVALGAAAMLAPSAGLAGEPPQISGDAGKALLGTDTHRHLLQRLRAPRGSKLQVSGITLGNRPVAKAVHRRTVALSSVHRALRNVTALAAESVLIGASAAGAVVLGHVPDPLVTVDEVQHFVTVLVEGGKVDHGGGRKGGARKREERSPHRPTHAVRVRNGRKVLTRTRFTCGA